MQKICASRHKEILDRSQNSLNEDMTNFKRNLSDMEMNSFKVRTVERAGEYARAHRYDISIR